jgi:hypothetical protein
MSPREGPLVDVPFTQVTHGVLPYASRQAVDEQSAIQMVHLMLDAASQQALALDHDGLAQPIDPSHSGVLRPLERVPQLRDGKASFIAFLLTLDRLDHGVDDVPDPPIDVVGEGPAAHPDLVGGQARAPGPGDGLLQIGYQPGERLIERADGIAWGTEHGITEQTDGTLGHRAILP